GTAWTVIPSPNPGSTPQCRNSNTGNVLNAIAAVSSNDVWAVGFSFPCNALLRPLIIHWDGTRWKAVQNPGLRRNDNSALNGIVALAADNIYAVGYQPAANGAVLTLIEHWDGSTWKVVPSPNANGTGNVLSSVSANSPNDIWAVGDQVAPNVAVKTLTLHFDGNQWTVVPSPNLFTSGALDQNVLAGVQAVSANHFTAAGFALDFTNHRTLTLNEHLDVPQWSIIPSPNKSETSGSLNLLRGITAISATDLYAAGFFADATTAGQEHTLVEHFDGSNWTIISSP